MPALLQALRFADAATVVHALPSGSSKAKSERREMDRKCDWLASFKEMLIADIEFALVFRRRSPCVTGV